jgi:hypothetical protein
VVRFGEPSDLALHGRRALSKIPSFNFQKWDTSADQ